MVFRDIFLEKPRTAFSIHFDNDKYSRSYYPGARVPQQGNLVFDNVRVLYDAPADFLQIRTPVNVVNLVNCSFRNNRIAFLSNKAMTDYLKTRINMTGCVFGKAGKMQLVVNSVPNKMIQLKTANSVELADDFSAVVVPGGGSIAVESDLSGLKK